MVLVCGVDEEGKLIINDPNSVDNSIQHWELEKITSQIRNIWLFEKM